MAQESRRQSYWRRNTKLIAVLLSVWAIFALLFSILLVEPLNQLGSVGRLPLGFWTAQQGSIYVFVGLIFVYAIQMDKLDQRFSQHTENLDQKDTGDSES